MPLTASVVLFVVGLAVGSFANVVATRFREGGKLLTPGILRGRSHCPICQKPLRWFELVPLISFIIQRGRCRGCHARLSWQYPAVELITGLIVLFVPLRLAAAYRIWELESISVSLLWFYALALTWIIALVTLIIISLIDLKYFIIPNQASLLLGWLGVIVIAIQDFKNKFGAIEGSLVWHHALLFGFRENVWLNHVLGAVVGLVFFGLIVALTRGRAMGMGDVKLAGALGFLAGWPDSVIALMFAFIIGAIVGISLMIRRHKTLKDAVPFGPFIAAGMFVVFFFGPELFSGYFQLFNLF